MVKKFGHFCIVALNPLTTKHNIANQKFFTLVMWQLATPKLCFKISYRVKVKRGMLICVGMPIFSDKYSMGKVYFGATLIKNSGVCLGAFK